MIRQAGVPNDGMFPVRTADRPVLRFVRRTGRVIRGVLFPAGIIRPATASQERSPVQLIITARLREQGPPTVRRPIRNRTAEVRIGRGHPIVKARAQAAGPRIPLRRAAVAAIVQTAATRQAGLLTAALLRQAAAGAAEAAAVEVAAAAVAADKCGSVINVN